MTTYILCNKIGGALQAPVLLPAAVSLVGLQHQNLQMIIAAVVRALIHGVRLQERLRAGVLARRRDGRGFATAAVRRGRAQRWRGTA